MEHDIQLRTYDGKPFGVMIDGISLMPSDTCIEMIIAQSARVDRAISVAVAAIIGDFLLLGLLIFMILTVR